MNPSSSSSPGPRHCGLVAIHKIEMMTGSRGVEGALQGCKLERNAAAMHDLELGGLVAGVVTVKLEAYRADDGICPLSLRCN
ncbi:hypothetical protein OsI_23276 [Oryza sativa Indica Group]|uniref:Uncharacterized protein n=1 Tax=Oryza sativa subsp. indica TaxID=39946 RepID=A2YDU0_ORYSI|nr:hypothetical protein OsI_23276 [Oryza sativa Indica Group]